MADSPKLFTIPSGVPFAGALARFVLARHGGAPERLAQTLIYVPTRRAIRAVTQAFAEAAGGQAMLLPRIAALGDLDGDAALAADPATIDLPPAISPMRRALLIAAELMAWPAAAGGAAMTLATALPVAEALASLIDEAATAGVSLDALPGLVTEREFAAHWERSAGFVAQLARQWPAILAREGVLDPSTRRDRMLRAQAERYRRDRPGTPVIAAGSTGSIPATAELLAAIATLPEGAVILPGLDRDLDEAAWDVAGPDHPQAGMRDLLRHLGVTRAGVTVIGGENGDGDGAARAARRRLFSEALRPPPATERWRDLFREGADWLAEGVRGLSLVEAGTPGEEATVIALAMRQALATPGRTAALVTPDRALARRVEAALARFGLAADDSAGLPLDKTLPGSFLLAIADALADDLAPVPLLALLKHPLAAGGLTRPAFRSLARLLERRALRGPRPGPGLEGLAAAAAAVGDDDTSRARAALRGLVERLGAALAPLAAALASGDLGAVADAHAAAAEALAATEDAPEGGALWSHAAGRAAAEAMSALAESGAGIRIPGAGAYAAVLARILSGVAVRMPNQGHPRLAIWGPLEARLQRADLMILGGLNEGTWPVPAAPDPWLSRPMRATLGLDSPERQIGLSAHDFVQGASHGDVLLTRSLKAGGDPAVASRWVWRLRQLLRGAGLEAALEPVLPLRAWALGLDHAPTPAPARRPRPSPPEAIRPPEIRVTEVETLIRDPYAIYARRILRLKPLDPLDQDAAAAERGTWAHAAFEAFFRDHPRTLPPDPAARLMAIATALLPQTTTSPAARAVWLPRLARAAAWYFAQFEAAHRAGVAFTHVECDGLWEYAPGRTLKARADRIDRMRDGTLVILDYKTGRPPSDKQIAEHVRPQLSLEAVMAEAGAFTGIDGTVAQTIYLGVRGLGDGGEIVACRTDAAFKADVASRFLALMERYRSAPYVAQAMPETTEWTGDYDHLARRAEWDGEGA